VSLKSFVGMDVVDEYQINIHSTILGFRESVGAYKPLQHCAEKQPHKPL
jgi:hypothetical protein